MSTKINKRKGVNAYRVFTIFNILFMLFIILITAYPIYYTVMASFSDPVSLSKHTGLLWKPLEPFTVSAYEMVFSNPLIVSGFKNTLFILIVGVVVNLLFTMLGAFFLTIKGPVLKSGIAFMIIFTMYFF